MPVQPQYEKPYAVLAGYLANGKIPPGCQIEYQFIEQRQVLSVLSLTNASRTYKILLIINNSCLPCLSMSNP